MVLLFAGQALAECPPGYPIDCGDGWCCPAGTSCAGGGQCQDNIPECPSDFPVNCGDGTCCPANTACGSDGQCYPIDDQGQGPKQCPAGTLTCITYLCNTDGIYCCPAVHPYLNHYDCLCYSETPDVPSYSQCTE